MKLNLLYTINKCKINSKELCGITCRLTYLKSRKQFSTGLIVNPNNWNSKQQLVEPPEPDIEYINTQLSLIRQNLNQAFLFLQVKGSALLNAMRRFLILEGLLCFIVKTL